jgi:DNA primase large subunit
LQDNLRLFEIELKKIKNGDKRIKEYQYMIEHMYGKKGKKTDYSPWSCQKIAQKATPGFGEVYGCPYVFYARDKLESILSQRGIHKEGI